MTDRKLIGYTESAEGFVPLYETPPGYIVTAAFVLCKHCRGAIASMGGPRYDAVCLACYKKDTNEPILPQ
jgi:hypothetical protein